MASLDEVLQSHAPLLARIAASYEAEPARRQDLLQDISVALWRALPAWRGQSALRTYVARIAHNTAVDHVSRMAGRVEAALDEDAPDPAADPLHTADAQQRRARLLQAIRHLPLGQRQVLVLSLEGFSQAESAQALGIEENTVAQRLSRARRQLRDELGVRA